MYLLFLFEACGIEPVKGAGVKKKMQCIFFSTQRETGTERRSLWVVERVDSKRSAAVGRFLLWVPKKKMHFCVRHIKILFKKWF